MILNMIDKKDNGVKFCDLQIGEIFYVQKENKYLEYIKLSNNIIEDNIGNTMYMVSSDRVTKEIYN